MNSSKNKYIYYAIIAAVISVYLFINLSLFARIPVIGFGDSDVFEKVSSYSWIGMSFWANEKPPVTAMVFRWLKNDGYKITEFFNLLAMAAWLVLAVVVGMSIRHYLLGMTVNLRLALWLIIIFSLDSLMELGRRLTRRRAYDTG